MPHPLPLGVMSTAARHCTRPDWGPCANHPLKVPCTQPIAPRGCALAELQRRLPKGGALLGMRPARQPDDAHTRVGAGAGIVPGAQPAQRALDQQRLAGLTGPQHQERGGMPQLYRRSQARLDLGQRRRQGRPQLHRRRLGAPRPLHALGQEAQRSVRPRLGAAPLHAGSRCAQEERCR